MKRLLILILAAVMMLGVLTSCGKTGKGGDTTVEAVPVEITADNANEYIIIRSSKSSDDIKNAAVAFSKKINEDFGKSTFEGIGLKEDFEKNPDELPEKAKEIIVGKSNRRDGAEIEKNLREKDYAIVFKNDRIFIVGGSDSATLQALDYFKATYYNEGTKKISVKSDLNYIKYYDYPVKSISVDGVDIKEYSIVVPTGCDAYTKYAAENLNDYLFANAGIKLNTVSDSAVETKYEILIGNTSRDASKVTDVPEKGEYSFFTKNEKIVCLGDSYLVGGGVSELLSKIDASKKNTEIKISGITADATPKTFTFSEAKNAILMIGDGMGFNSVAASIQNNAIKTFNGYDLPNQGESKTNSLSGTTDSAAGATALSTGYKTTNKYLGVDKNQKKLLNVRELADSTGAMTAVITTDLITGATPSGFLVHHNLRTDTDIIQGQINKVIANGEIEYCAGSVDNNLKKCTVEALRKISEGDSSFFMMIEEGQIDKKSHNNNMTEMVKMLARFNDDIAYVIEFTVCHPDTALIITADHETGGITPDATGKYVYTVGDHTAVNVPICAIGAGTEMFNGKAVENVEIAKFMASIYSTEKFGQ